MRSCPLLSGAPKEIIGNLEKMIGGMRRRYKVTSNVTLLKNLAKLPLITVNIDLNYRPFPFSSVGGNGKGGNALFPFTCVSALSPWTCTTQSTPRKTECRFHTGASKTAWMCTTLNSCCKLPKVSHRNSKIATTAVSNLVRQKIVSSETKLWWSVFTL